MRWLVAAVFVPNEPQRVVDPSEALYGEWEIVEITFKGKAQVLPERPVGWFIFEKGGFTWLLYGDVKKIREDIHRSKLHRKAWTEPCIIGPQEIQVLQRYPTGPKTAFTAKYEINGDTLRFIWNEDGGDKPTHFDALKDRSLALYVAKRVK